MPEDNSITVGPLTLTWNGQGLTVGTPGGQYELDGNGSYELLNWLYDNHRGNLYRAAHPARSGGQHDELVKLGSLDIDALSRQWISTVDELTQPAQPED
jgi:hypothetical protein